MYGDKIDKPNKFEKLNQTNSRQIDSSFTCYPTQIQDSNLRKQLEDCTKEFYSLSISNDVYNSQRNIRSSFSFSNLNDGSDTIIRGEVNQTPYTNTNNISFFKYFQIYDLLKKTVDLSSAILDENLNLKSAFFENEKNLVLLQNEISEKCDYMNKYNNLFEENIKIQDDFFKSNKQISILRENESRLKELVNIQNERLKEIEESLNILEIEKEELHAKNEILEKRFDEEVKKLEKLKKIVIANEDEAKLKSNSLNYQSTSTKCSFDAPRKLTEHLCTETENNYVSTLGDICPELEEVSSTDLNLNLREKDEKNMRISLTPNDIVRRFSLTDRDLFNNYKDVKKEINFNFDSKTTSNNINSNKNKQKEIQFNSVKPITITNENIYKEFFLLTFQSIKLNCNSKHIDLFKGVDSEKLYQKIIKQNIPFHNFSEYIKLELGIDKPARLSQNNIFGKFSEIFEKN